MATQENIYKVISIKNKKKNDEKKVEMERTTTRLSNFSTQNIITKTGESDSEEPMKKKQDELFDDFGSEKLGTTFQRKSAQELGVRLRIDNLTEINTVMQKYAIKGALYTQWKMSKKDIQNWDNSHKEYIKIQRQKWNSIKGEFQTVTVKEEPPAYIPEITPEVLLINCIEMEDQQYQKFGKSIYRQMKNKRTGEPYNAMVLNFKGWFTEEFEVQNFPFDVQDLSICVVGLFGGHKRLICPSRCTYDTIQIDRTFNSITDWSIEGVDSQNWLIDFLSATTRGQKKGGLTDTNSYCQFRIQVQRKWFIYFSRVLLWLFSLGCVTFGMFCFKPDNIEGRLNYCITMILTIVAFQFVISSELPKVAYLTFIDKYNLFIFSFIFLGCFESCLVGYQENGVFKNGDEIDAICAILLGIVYFIGNIIFLIMAINGYNKERTKLGVWNKLERDVCSYHLWQYDYKDSQHCNNDPDDDTTPKRLY